MNNETYLSHHGVPGQKHGIRRYQYPDGSLTPEGREHYGIKEMRVKARYDRAMVRERAKAERKMEKLHYKQRVKDEARRQKLKDAERARRQKDYADRKAKEEKDRLADIENQKKQIAKFKKEHPLKYKQLKKYIKEDGTLNDAGKARFFGTGNKKKIDQMSTEDLKRTTDRMYAEKNYNQALYELNKSDPSSRRKAAIGRTLGVGGLTFISSFLGKTSTTGLSKETAIENGRNAVADAIGMMGISTTRQLGLSSKKGGKGYNAFEGVEQIVRNNANLSRYMELRRNGEVVTLDRTNGEIVRVEPEEYYDRNRQ